MKTMSELVFCVRYVRWWRKRLVDWNRQRDTRLFFEWAKCWIDPEGFDALRRGISPEDAAAEDASNA
jgi:hypothetical protein